MERDCISRSADTVKSADGQTSLSALVQHDSSPTDDVSDIFTNTNFSRRRQASDYFLSHVVGIAPPIHFSHLSTDSDRNSEATISQSFTGSDDEGSYYEKENGRVYNSRSLLTDRPLVKRSYGRSLCCRSCLPITGLLSLVLAVLVLLPLLMYHETDCKSFLAKSPEKVVSELPLKRFRSSISDADKQRLRLHQVRMLGTHNSYHIAPPPPLSWLSHEWRYTHASLRDQLELHGVRSIELDLHQVGDSLYIYHVQLFDYRTHCYCLEECLVQVKNWMDTRRRAETSTGDASYGHEPLTVFFEAKTKFVEDRRAGLRGGFFDYDLLESVIASVFDPEDIFSPLEVQRNYSSVSEALIKTRGTAWPTLEEAHNKIMFVMYDYFPESEQSVIGKRNILFSAVPDKTFKPDSIHPRTSFVIVDDPYESRETAESALDKGFIVRMRSDDKAYLNENRTRTAIEVGAQIIATDFEHIVKGWVY